MSPKRWLLFFTFVGVLVLAFLYIRNNHPEPRPGPQLQIPGPTPGVVPARPSEALKPTFPPPRLVDANRNLVRKVQPQYTQAARKAHYEGQVQVNIIIGTDGIAHNIEIVNSPGYGMDQNIIEAVKQWLWDSVFIREDQKATITIVFKLAH
jgi:TonB family protein